MELNTAQPGLPLLMQQPWQDSWPQAGLQLSQDNRVHMDKNPVPAPRGWGETGAASAQDPQQLCR